MNAQFTQEFKANIQERVDNGYAPSIAVGIIDSTGMKFYNYGKKTIEGDKHVGEETIYEIGSISKVFTSLLLAQMVEAGKMNLDDPIQKYLPNINVPAYKGTPITLRHLATHNSGLPRLPENLDLGVDPMNPYAHYDEEMLLDFLASYKLNKEPGTVHEYSNLGAGLLGYILTKENKMSLEELFQTKVGNVLGLENTTIQLSDEQKENLALGHMGDEPVQNWDFQDALAGGGAFRSNVIEMLSFLKMQLPLDGNIPSEAVKLTQKLQAEVGRKMGLGWHFSKDHIRWHNGGTGGYKSFCGIDLEKNRGVVVLSNSTYSVDDLGLYLLGLTDELEGTRPIAKVDPKIYEEYAGKYVLSGIMIMEVTTKNGKLYFQPMGQPDYRIYPASETLYFMQGIDVELEFVRDENGKVNSFIFEQNNYKQEAKRQKE